MIKEHLNEEEIQQYILHKEKCDAEMIKHLQDCETCKINAAHYHLLFIAIQQQEKAAFDFDLADVVIEQLPQSRYKTSNDTLFSFFIIFISVFFVFILFISFKNSLLNFFKGIASISVALMITSILCLFIILLIDMYRKYQTRINSLDFY